MLTSDSRNVKTEFVYPPEASGYPKRMCEWDKAHKGGRISPRARTMEQHRQLLRYKWWCEDSGVDICHLIVSHAQADIAGFDEIEPFIKTGLNIINLQQQNNFISQVARLRRSPDPGVLNSSNRGIPGTTYRLAFEDHVLPRALRLSRSFCFRDFPNLTHNHFKKIILRLKKKEYIVAQNPRTCPRLYIVTPQLLFEIVDRESLSTPFGVNEAVDSKLFQRKERAL